MFLAGAAPELREPLHDVTVIAGQQAKLKCQLSKGDPAASMRWLKDNRELPKNKKYTISYSDAEATLLIDDTQLSDAGSFRFEASNKLGRVETQCSLAVKGDFSFCY